MIVVPKYGNEKTLTILSEFKRGGTFPKGCLRQNPACIAFQQAGRTVKRPQDFKKIVEKIGQANESEFLPGQI